MQNGSTGRSVELAVEVVDGGDVVAARVVGNQPHVGRRVVHHRRRRRNQRALEVVAQAQRVADLVGDRVGQVFLHALLLGQPGLAHLPRAVVVAIAGRPVGAQGIGRQRVPDQTGQRVLGLGRRQVRRLGDHVAGAVTRARVRREVVVEDPAATDVDAGAADLAGVRVGAPVGERVAQAGVGIEDDEVLVVVGEVVARAGDLGGERGEAERVVPALDAALDRGDQVELRHGRVQVGQRPGDVPLDRRHPRIQIPVRGRSVVVAAVADSVPVAAEIQLLPGHRHLAVVVTLVVVAQRDAQRARGAERVGVDAVTRNSVACIAGEDLLVGDAVGDLAEPLQVRQLDLEAPRDVVTADDAGAKPVADDAKVVEPGGRVDQHVVVGARQDLELLPPGDDRVGLDQHLRVEDVAGRFAVVDIEDVQPVVLHLEADHAGAQRRRGATVDAAGKILLQERRQEPLLPQRVLLDRQVEVFAGRGPGSRHALLVDRHRVATRSHGLGIDLPRNCDEVTVEDDVARGVAGRSRLVRRTREQAGHRQRGRKRHESSHRFSFRMPRDSRPRRQGGRAPASQGSCHRERNRVRVPALTVLDRVDR